MGPLLFTIYTNDLSWHITLGNTFLYANDTAVVITADNPAIMTHMLNHTMNELDTWFCSNKLSLNTSKSKLMLFGTQPQLTAFQDVSVSHRGSELERCQKFKYLGVMLDVNLTLERHISIICGKVSARTKLRELFTLPWYIHTSIIAVSY